MSSQSSRPNRNPRSKSSRSIYHKKHKLSRSLTSGFEIESRSPKPMFKTEDIWQATKISNPSMMQITTNNLKNKLPILMPLKK
jgi:hypothetical protein